MSRRVTGTDRVRHRISKIITRDNGSRIEEEWIGTPEALSGLFYTYARQAEEVQLVEAEGLGRLRISDGTRVVHFQEGVRMITQRVSKSIFEPPGLKDVSDEDLVLIHQLIQDNETPTFSWANPNAGKLYELAVKGVRSRVVYQPFLIKTVSAGRAQEFQISFANVGRIISPGSIVNDAGVEGLLRWALPDQNPSGYSDYCYGWLKHMPGVEPGPNGTQILTQEYEYGLWSEFLHDPPL